MLFRSRSEEHTSELQSPCNLVCRLLLEKKKIQQKKTNRIITRPRPTVSAASAPRTSARGATPPARAALPVSVVHVVLLFFFFFNDTATPEISPLSLPDALPISGLEVIAFTRKPHRAPPAADLRQ